jgi:peptidoglycan-associated lipoprotein
MRLSHFALVLVAVTAAGCSKKQPEVAPTPTAEPQPASPATPAPPPAAPAVDRATCEAAITAVVSEVGRVVNFDTDRYDIRDLDAVVLDAKAAVLRTHPAVRLRVVGHADERYTDEYNLILGTRRAEAAKDYLVGRGIEASRLETASLGETAPVDPGHTEAAWARNRRAEFTVVAGRETLASHVAGCR